MIKNEEISEKIIVTRILDLLLRDKALSDYFSNDIKWFQDRLVYWQNNYIRVGLIGVTSSGKSTLLNALFGEELLPVKVRPSSGVLVTCSRSNQKQATVYFENGKVQPITKRVTYELAQYGDEQYNPQNKKGVKYLDVRSSQFAFDETIQIVDSPGLDADGLEGHEALTLETLLPSVDVCIYLVTLKANSDETTYRVLHSIHKHDKPLVVVQNMADSVRHKEGSNGVLLKTRKTVLSEHRERIRRIIAQVDETLPTVVPIVQVSAKEGLISQMKNNCGAYEKSAIPQMIQCIEQQIAKIRPQITAKRLLQIKKHLQEMLVNEEPKLRKAVIENRSISVNKGGLLGQRDQANLYFLDVEQGMKQIMARLAIDISSTAKKLEELSDFQIDQAANLLECLKERARFAEKELVGSISSFNAEIGKVLVELNLNQRDYAGDILPNKPIAESAFAVKKKIDVYYTKEEKDGFVSWIGRKIGWGGYEEVRREREIIDLSAIKVNLDTYAKSLTANIIANIRKWKEKVDILQNVVNEEVRRREEDQKKKEHTQLELEKRRVIISQLRAILIEVAPETADEDITMMIHEQRLEENRTDIPIPEVVYGCYQLSHQISQLPFRMAGAYCQEANENKLGNSLSATVVWGDDTDCLHQFSQQFFDVSITQHDEQTLEKIGYVVKKDKSELPPLVLVKEQRVYSDINVTRKLNPILGDSYNVYLLVNAVQQGAVEKQLKRTPLWSILENKSTIVNWVTQSFSEFTNGGYVDEGIASLVSLRDKFDMNGKGLLLLNHREPIYTLVLLHLQTLSTLTPTDEKSCNEMVISLSQNDPEVIKHTAQLMRAYAHYKQ